MQREVTIRTINIGTREAKFLVIFNQQTPIGDYRTEYRREYSTSAAATMDAREYLISGQPPIAEEDIEELAL